MKFLCVAMLMVFAAPAAAQLDQGVDGLGVYFDPWGYTNVTTATGSVTAYLCLTNPSRSSVYGFSCRVGIEGNASLLSYSFPPPGGLNVLTSPAFEVGYVAPQSEQNNVVLLATLVITVGSGPVAITVSGAGEAYEGQAVYMTMPEELIVMNPSGGRDAEGAYLPCAVINGEAPVESRLSSWGRIKSLHR